MIKEEEVYKIGKINSPHGIHGELQFTFSDDIFDCVNCEYLVCLIDGIYVPFFIEEYSFKSATTALLKFEGIDTAEQARQLTNVDVFFPIKYTNGLKSERIDINFLQGFLVEDTRFGYLGTITAIDTSTANTLIVIKKDNNEILLPAHEEFICHINQEQRTVTTSIPYELLNLNITAKNN